MIKRRTEQKGFTLVEMMITVVIATMIMGAITTGIVVMTKSYELNQDLVDIQYQAQVTLNTLVEEIKYSRGIAKVYETNLTEGLKEITNTSTSAFIDSFCIEELEREEEHGKPQYTYFLLEDSKLYILDKQTSDTLKPDVISKEEDLGEYLLATYVSNIRLTPVQGSFKTTKSVNIEITFQKNGANLTLSNQATMRNKE